MLWGIILLLGMVAVLPPMVDAGTLLLDQQALSDAMANAVPTVTEPGVRNQLAATYRVGVARELGVAPRSLVLERFLVREQTTPDGPLREVQATMAWTPVLPVPLSRETIVASVTVEGAAPG